LSRQISAKDTI